MQNIELSKIKIKRDIWNSKKKKNNNNKVFLLVSHHVQLAILLSLWDCHNDDGSTIQNAEESQLLIRARFDSRVLTLIQA